MRAASHGRVGLEDVLRAQVQQATANAAKGSAWSAPIACCPSWRFR